MQVLTRRANLPRPMLHGTGQLQPLFGPQAAWDRPLDFAKASGQLRDTEGNQMPDESLGVLAFLAAMAVMMMTPTVAERRTLDVRTGRPADRVPDARPDNLVTTIDLRPLRHVTDEPGEGGRIYRHRWIVRGHWTHQPHGPGGDAEARLPGALHQGPGGGAADHLLQTVRMRSARRVEAPAAAPPGSGGIRLDLVDTTGSPREGSARDGAVRRYAGSPTPPVITRSS